MAQKSRLARQPPALVFVDRSHEKTIVGRSASAGRFFILVRGKIISIRSWHLPLFTETWIEWSQTAVYKAQL